jgi:ectoine hydroxylase-related dioxygenase (phytanoyl-CoA dioxygenase family)
MFTTLYTIYRGGMTNQSAIATRSAEFVDSLPLLENPNALRARALEDGYLFFRGLLPVADVLALRAEFLAVVERHGWRTPNQDALGDLIEKTAIDEVSDADMRLDIGVSIAAYNDVQRLERFHRLPHHPKLLALFSTLFGRRPFVHPRHIARMVTPHRGMVPTPIHQDFPLIQGSQNTWTCWFPLGDCSREIGGLSILRGSHRNGYLPVQMTGGAGGLEAQLCEGETDWLEIDYRCGDVLIFPCFTVHRALRAISTDRIRLSLDVRYQPDDEPIEAKSLQPHCDLSWEEIYAGWTSRELQYYWNALNLEASPWNDALFQPSTRIC